MRIDTHFHVGGADLVQGSRPGLAAQMDELAACGIDGAWISSIDAMMCSELDRQRAMHDQMAEMIAAHPGRLWGFCTVNPSAKEQAADEVRRCVRELGFIGVKLHPWLQAFSVVANAGMPLIMEAAEELGVPVMFHDGSPPFSTPRQIGYMASRFPRVKVILGHAGIADLWRDAGGVGRENPNVYLQPTAVPAWVVRAAYEAVGPDRMLFGSDGGFGSTDAIRQGLRIFREALGEGCAERILSGSHRRVCEVG